MSSGVLRRNIVLRNISENNIEGWKVGSAGIFAEPASVDPKILETLQRAQDDAMSTSNGDSLKQCLLNMMR